MTKLFAIGYAIEANTYYLTHRKAGIHLIYAILLRPEANVELSYTIKDGFCHAFCWHVDFGDSLLQDRVERLNHQLRRPDALHLSLAE